MSSKEDLAGQEAYGKRKDLSTLGDIGGLAESRYALKEVRLVL